MIVVGILLVNCASITQTAVLKQEGNSNQVKVNFQSLCHFSSLQIQEDKSISVLPLDLLYSCQLFYAGICRKVKKAWFALYSALVQNLVQPIKMG